MNDDRIGKGPHSIAALRLIAALRAVLDHPESGDRLDAEVRARMEALLAELEERHRLSGGGHLDSQ